MTQKQFRTFKVIVSYIDKSISRQQAAELLELSPRQITRLKKGVLASGPESLIHKNTGRKPANAIDEKVRERIIEIHSHPEFADVNFSHFREILSDDYDIDLSYTSLSSILKSARITSPMQKKQKKRHVKRMRKPHPGELIQIDATPYAWFGGKAQYALHGAIDDATGNIVGLHMTDNECLFGYFETMRQCLTDFGVPQTIYSDRHTIFKSPKADKLSVEEIIKGKKVRLTQFGRAMYDLGVDMVFAQSPQAKGRIERLWATLQSRLPVEFARHGIKTVSEANEFLSEYRFKYNEMFSVEPEGVPMYVSLRPDLDLDSILCIKVTRKTDNAGTFSFKGRCFQILDDGFPIIPAKCNVTVLISPKKCIRVEHAGRIYCTVRYIKPDKTTVKRSVPKKVLKAVIPHLNTVVRNGKKYGGTRITKLL